MTRPLHIIRYSLIVLCLFVAASSMAQQPFTQHSLYFINQYYINPGTAGLTNEVQGFLSYRKDFSSIQGAPETQLLSVHVPFSGAKFGLGGYLQRYTYGPQTRTSGQVSYTYHLEFADSQRLSLGLGLNIYNSVFDLSDYRATGDLSTADPVLLASSEGATNVDGTFGAMFTNKSFYTGFSVRNLAETENKFSFGTRDASSVNQRTFFWLTGFNIPVKEGIFDIEPSMLIRFAQATPPQADLNARFIFKDMVWLAFSYRAQSKYVASAGITLAKMFELAYAYDINNAVSDLGQYIGPSHEFGLRIRYNLAPEPELPDTNLLVEELTDTTTMDSMVVEAEPIRDSIPQDTIPVMAQDTTPVIPDPPVQDTIAAQDTIIKDTVPVPDPPVAVEEPEVPEPEPEKVETEKVEGYNVSTFDDKNKYFYVIGGSFGNFENAKAVFEKYKAKGFDVEMLNHKSKSLYRVSLFKSLEREPASSKTFELRKTLAPDIWMLHN